MIESLLSCKKSSCKQSTAQKSSFGPFRDWFDYNSEILL